MMMMIMMAACMRRDLSDTQLSGTLPPSVGNLTALKFMCGRLLSSAASVWRRCPMAFVADIRRSCTRCGCCTLTESVAAL